MKRGMLAVLFLVLLTSLAWGADWYRFQGTLSGRFWRGIPRSGGGSTWPEADVLLCYDTTPWSISVEYRGDVVFSGEFDQEGRTVQFELYRPYVGSGTRGETVPGHGSFNAKLTTLNLQGSSFLRWGTDSGDRGFVGEYRFRGKFVDVISR